MREGKSKVSPAPPLTLGSDLSGVVETLGSGVDGLKPVAKFTGSRTHSSTAPMPSIPSHQQICCQPT
ncbi:MAG: hypothetical protein JO356_13380 [Acidobacteria bacterium]|nr:hypothetical protein [Acidobacteriota bacterium]